MGGLPLCQAGLTLQAFQLNSIVSVTLDCLGEQLVIISWAGRATPCWVRRGLGTPALGWHHGWGSNCLAQGVFTSHQAPALLHWGMRSTASCSAQPCSLPKARAPDHRGAVVGAIWGGEGKNSHKGGAGL